MTGLPPGSYRLLFRTGGESRANRAYAGEAFEVTNRDLEDLKFRLSPGATLTALTTLDKTTLAKEVETVPGTLTLTLSPVDPDPRFVFPAPPKDPLSVEGVAPGSYWVGLAGLPKGFAVTAVAVNDRDAELYAPIPVSGATTLRFRITGTPGAITGTVKDRNGNPVPAEVTLTPDSLPRKSNPAAVQSTRPDANGNFNFFGLAPGRYRVAGSDATQTIEVHENETKQVSLQAP